MDSFKLGQAKNHAIGSDFHYWKIPFKFLTLHSSLKPLQNSKNFQFTTPCNFHFYNKTRIALSINLFSQGIVYVGMRSPISNEDLDQSPTHMPLNKYSKRSYTPLKGME